MINRTSRVMRQSTTDSESVFDPGTLALTGWWRAIYSASPWVGRASAGSSGSRDLTEAATPPSIGIEVTGTTDTTADFDGTNDQLVNDTPTDNFVSVGSYSVAVLFNADTSVADAGASVLYDNRALVSASQGINGGIWMVTHSASGVRAGHWDGASWKSVVKAAGTGGWHLAIFTYDGTDLKLCVDDVSDVAQDSLAHGNLHAGSLVSDKLRVGCNYNISKFFDGRIAEIMIAQEAWSSTSRSNIKTYVNSWSGLAL